MQKEKGVICDNGLLIKANALSSNALRTGRAFDVSFVTGQAVFGQVASHAGSDPVVTRIDDVTTDRSDFLFQ
ncbi:MAG: hypothetical protein R8G34_07010 [Paracoccaceae bacterium]|nr:hypothetical protein [Paracoccaceae bacterium]